MKPFILSLFLLATLPATAQKNELGLNVGAALSSIPTYTNAGYAIAVKEGRNIGRHLQAGVSVAAFRIYYEGVPAGMAEAAINNQGTIAGTGFYMLKLQLNYRKELQKSVIYGGLSTGYAHAIPYREQFMRRAQPNGGVTYGGQIGYTVFWKEHVGFNAELAPSFIPLHTGHVLYINGRYTANQMVVSIPLTVGIHYRF